VHIRDVLDAISKQDSSLIDKFGGHSMAAGLTINIDKLAQFKLAFTNELNKHMTSDDCIGRLLSDGELKANDFSLSTAAMIEQAGPWGQEFPRPLFDNEFELVDQRLLGGKHLKMTLRANGTSELIDAIAFNVAEGEWPNHRARKVHCAYYLDVNRYQGRSRLQLMVEHLEPIK
jgi:single-stranded-DNA-specific exonuclease